MGKYSGWLNNLVDSIEEQFRDRDSAQLSLWPLEAQEKPAAAAESEPEPEPVYRDEPILMRASQLPKPAPREYKELRRISTSPTGRRMSQAEIFYRQAKLMEDFTDEHPFHGDYPRYYPTYDNMTLAEQRGYFTWRSHLRQGQLEETATAFPRLYVYELLMNIGVSSPEDGFHQLTALMDAYEDINPYITIFIEEMLPDYVAYYGLPPEALLDYFPVEFGAAVGTLMRCQEIPDEELFPALLLLSTYHMEKSKLYKQHPEETVSAVCAAVRSLSGYYETHGQKRYHEKLFGINATHYHRMFRGALFYDFQPRVKYQYSLTPVQTYICSGGSWYITQPEYLERPSKELGVFLKAIDCRLRDQLEMPPLKWPEKATKIMERHIDKALKELAKQKATAPKAAPIVLDLSKLSGIRQAAEETQNRLMTEEERYVPEAPVPTPQTAPEGVSPLSSQEQEFLRRLYQGGDWAGYLREQKLMASVLSDRINEKLYDIIGDTVIEFSGDAPEIIEDYREELGGLIP